jgi:hypothetical protein
MTGVPGIEPQTSRSQVQHSTTRPYTPTTQAYFFNYDIIWPTVLSIDTIRFSAVCEEE